jgi:hypothetical protein
MTEADSVHSTPRKTASKIKPGQKAARSCGHSYRSSTTWKPATAALACICRTTLARSHGHRLSCKASRQDCGRWAANLIPQTKGTGNEQYCRVPRSCAR